MPDGTEPVDSGELLFRKIPVSMNWYDEDSDDLSPQAFHPTKHDDDGLSLERNAEYCSVEEAAQGKSAQGYYVVIVRAGDLIAAGVEIRPDPIKGSPGHVILPALNYSNRNTDASHNLKARLAKDWRDGVHGPFTTAVDD